MLAIIILLLYSGKISEPYLLELFILHLLFVFYNAVKSTSSFLKYCCENIAVLMLTDAVLDKSLNRHAAGH